MIPGSAVRHKSQLDTLWTLLHSQAYDGCGIVVVIGMYWFLLHLLILLLLMMNYLVIEPWHVISNNVAF